MFESDEVPVANKLDGGGRVRDVGLVFVPLLDPEVVVIVLVRVHRHLGIGGHTLTERAPSMGKKNDGEFNQISHIIFNNERLRTMEVILVPMHCK